MPPSSPIPSVDYSAGRSALRKAGARLRAQVRDNDAQFAQSGSLPRPDAQPPQSALHERAQPASRTPPPVDVARRTPRARGRRAAERRAERSLCVTCKQPFDGDPENVLDVVRHTQTSAHVQACRAALAAPLPGNKSLPTLEARFNDLVGRETASTAAQRCLPRARYPAPAPARSSTERTAPKVRPAHRAPQVKRSALGRTEAVVASAAAPHSARAQRSARGSILVDLARTGAHAARLH